MERHHSVRFFLCVMISFVFLFTYGASAVTSYGAAVKINKTKLTLYVKKTAKLKVIGAKTVKWSSSKKTVAKVSSKGVVTALKKGSATITAKAGKKKLTCKVTVKNPTISASSAILYVGDTKQLTVKNAVGTVKWSSSDTTVAEVSAKGLVTAAGAGSATVTAAASGLKLTCRITVKADIVPVPSDDALNVCIATEPDSLDPSKMFTLDQATMLSHLFSGLARCEKKGGKLCFAADMAEELTEPVKGSDGKYTYTYKIRSDARWSDGQPVKAQDFVYAWNRVITEEFDYSYLFEDVARNQDGTLNIKAVDDSTLKVVAEKRTAYWNEFLAHPVTFPVRKDIVEKNASWDRDPSTFVSNGMYILTGWDHDKLISMTRNEDHPNASRAAMKVLNFYLSGDTDRLYEEFTSGALQFVDEIDFSKIDSKYAPYLKEDDNLGTYFLIMNTAQDLSPAGGTRLTATQQNEVRTALNLLIDRDNIVNKVAVGGNRAASSFVPNGIVEADGSEFYKNAGNSSDHIGYWYAGEGSKAKNTAQSMEILKKYYTVANEKVTDFPELTYAFNDDSTHQAIAEAVQSDLDEAGITLTLKPCTWNSYSNTLNSGDFSFARLGWFADFNDALVFLNIWTTDSSYNYGKIGSNDAKYSMDLSDISGYADKSVASGTWKETYDVLMRYISSENDPAIRCKLLHKGEDMLMEAGLVCSLYYYTDSYLISDKVSGYFSDPKGIKFFMYTALSD